MSRLLAVLGGCLIAVGALFLLAVIVQNSNPQPSDCQYDTIVYAGCPAR